MERLRVLRDGMRTCWIGSILAYHDTEPAELCGALLKVMLGFWMLLPFDTFSSSPSFGDLAVVPEWIWGGVLFLFGFGHLIALRDGHRPWRRLASLVGFLVWFTMAVTFVLANPPSMGWLMFLMAALGQGWAWVRLRGPG